MENHEFFLSVTPGLEDLAQLELNAWLGATAGWPPNTEVRLERGGLQLYLPLNCGLELNRCLKIPTRILLRVADFGCRDFPKLFKKFQNLSWEQWVSDETPLEFEVSSHSSRLAIKRRILETCADGRRAYLKKKGLRPPEAAASSPPQTIFVRVLDDVCTVSLDTSGDLLHKRGLRTYVSEAPIRESIAAALLYGLIAGEDQGLTSAISVTKAGGVELVDPMTGGGTFLLEAAGLTHRTTTRRYAFENNVNLLTRSQGGFSVDAPANTVDSAVVNAAANDSRAAARTPPNPFVSFVGIDLSERALEAARHNLSERLQSDREFRLETGDIFKAKPLSPSPARWLIANPPYGERLKVEGGLSKFYQRLFQACEKWAAPSRACFVLPAKVRPETIPAPAGWRLVSRRAFANGGIPVLAVVFVRVDFCPFVQPKISI